MSSKGPEKDRYKKFVLGHPGRRRILRRMPDRAVSLAQVAAAAEEPLGRTKHHLDLLVSWGAIAVVEQKRVGGFVERFYRRAHGGGSSDETGDESNRP